ncbi:hypothetical protein RSAG8_06379, partial [Rhizoctonia solani AG-8 WAC10335]
MVIVRDASDIEAELLDPLKSIMTNSPKLECLQFGFRGTPITPEHIASSLGAHFTLPYLYKFHLSGSFTFYPGTVRLKTPSGTGSNHFQAFLSRHALLEDLALDCVAAAGAIQRPILHLGSTWVLSNSRTTSITNWKLEPEDATGLEISNDDLNLPVLRELEIRVENLPKALEILELLMPATTGLEELEFPAVRYEYHEELLDLLAHTPDLRHLCLWNYDVSCERDTHAPVPGGLHRQELLARMKRMYPELQVDLREPMEPEVGHRLNGFPTCAGCVLFREKPSSVFAKETVSGNNLNQAGCDIVSRWAFGENGVELETGWIGDKSSSVFRVFGGVPVASTPINGLEPAGHGPKLKLS